MSRFRLDPDALAVQSFAAEPAPAAALAAEPVYQTDEERLSLCFVSCDTTCEDPA